MTTLNILICIIIGLQIADAATTLYALRQPGLSEGNGLMAKWFALVGVVPGLIVFKGAFIGLLIWAAPQIPVDLLYLIIGLYVWVFLNNLKQIKNS